MIYELKKDEFYNDESEDESDLSDNELHETIVKEYLGDGKKWGLKFEYILHQD